MKEVVIRETDIVSAANEGMDSFLSLFVKSIKDSVGGELNAENMVEFNVNQITLLAYDILHEEVMDGGFVQLIHNGYGGFIFQNPFAKVLKLWGLRDLSKLVYSGRALYFEHKDELDEYETLLDNIANGFYPLSYQKGDKTIIWNEWKRLTKDIKYNRFSKN